MKLYLDLYSLKGAVLVGIKPKDGAQIGVGGGVETSGDSEEGSIYTYCL